MELVITLAYDNLIKCFNFQLENNTYQKAEFKLPNKTFSAALDFPFLLICSNESKVGIIAMESIQNIKIPQRYDDIGIDQYSKCSCCSICAPENKIAVGSVDGTFCLANF